MEPDRPACRRRALDLLARREHSRLELERKLRRAEHSPELVAGVLDELERDGLLSDGRFAESFVRARIAKGQGPNRIRMELIERGVAAADETIRAAGCDWNRLARDTRARRFRGGTPRDYKERARQARFLEYRGFTAEQIRNALESADDSSPNLG
jgi:regulatory protein